MRKALMGRWIRVKACKMGGRTACSRQSQRNDADEDGQRIDRKLRDHRQRHAHEGLGRQTGTRVCPLCVATCIESVAPLWSNEYLNYTGY